MPDQGLLDVLRRSGGLVAVARQLDITPGIALTAVSALMPLVRGGFRQRIEGADNLSAGITEILVLLDGLGGGALVGGILQDAAPQPAAGKAVLEAIFGSDEVAAKVIDAAAAESEVDRAVVAAILPLLAMLAAGYVAARAGRMSPTERLAELGPLLDLDGAPNPLDDLA